MLIATVALFAAAAGLAWWRLGLLHPAQLWLTAWTLALGLASLHLLPYAPVADKTLALVAASSLAFVGASCLGGRFRPAPGGPRIVGAREVEWAGAALLAVALLGCALFVAQAIRDVGLRDSVLTSQTLRQPVQDGAYAVTVKYLYFALAAATMCAIAAGLRRERRRAWLVAAGVAVASTYFATGRATVVVCGLAATVAFVVASRARVRPGRAAIAVVATGLASLAVFVLMGQLIGKTYANSGLGTMRSFFSEHPRTSALATPYMYFSAPIGALNALVRHPPVDKSDGCAMLSVACTVISHAGIDARPTRPIRPFTAAPIPWNTYTALDDAIRDVGIDKAPIVFAVLGLLCGWLWARATRGRVWGIAVYAIVGTAILGSAGSSSFGSAHILGAVAIVLVSLPAAMAARILIGRR